MKVFPLTFALVLAPFLLTVGCGGTPARLAVSPETSELRLRPSARSIVVGDVDLPEYADASEVVRETPEGLIETVGDIIWADAPADALSNALVRNLSEITGASVASAPWPLDGFTDAELTVRVARMLGRVHNHLPTTGHVAVRRENGPWAERLRSFDIRVPVVGEGLLALADAHAVAWRQLAEEIAPNL